MAELTKEEVKRAFEEVVASQQFVDKFETIAMDVITSKMERVFGLDCTDHETRENTRKNMIFLQQARSYAESEAGQAEIATMRRLAASVNAATSNALRGLFYLVMAGFMAIAGVGAASHDGFRNLFK